MFAYGEINEWSFSNPHSWCEGHLPHYTWYQKLCMDLQKCLDRRLSLGKKFKDFPSGSKMALKNMDILIYHWLTKIKQKIAWVVCIFVGMYWS